MEESSEQIQAYLHEDVEVVLTGRTAIKELRHNKTDERVEITPKISTQGSWKKWVRRIDLYEIQE